MYKYLANTVLTGKKIIYLPSCHSTNDLARQYVQNKQILEGTLIITDNQTAGKGQRGNTWLAEPGQNLTFTVVYKPHFLLADESFYLNIIVSLALWDMLDMYSIHSVIKWPNDIFYQNKKVAGILIENTLDQRRINYSAIGIGLNVNQLTFSMDTATSMSGITGKTYNLQEVLENLLTRVEKYYLVLRSGKKHTLQEVYHQKLLGINSVRTFQDPKGEFQGIIRGVDGNGRLKVEIAGKMRYFSFKEISFIHR